MKKLPYSVSRRTFVKSSVIAGSSFFIMPKSRALGSEANSKIKIGMIGLGGRGSLILERLDFHGGYEIAAVADYFKDVAGTVGEKHAVPADRRFSGLNGYRKLVDSGVDAVFFETPPYCFPEHVEYAVDKGRHIYMAKPVACDVPGTLSIEASAERAKKLDKVFLVDFQERVDPYIIETVKRIHDGALGEIGILNVVCGSNGFEDPPLTKTIESRLQDLIWVNDVALGGGYLVNYDIHAMDVALWIAQDRPVNAFGRSRMVLENTHGDARRSYSVTYEFEDGHIMNHTGEHLKNLYNAIFCGAQGELGYAETNYAGKSWLRSNRNPYRGGESPDLYVEGIDRNVATFHKSVLAGNTENPTVKSSIDATLVTILGREAARRQTLLTLDELIKENKKLEVDYTGLII